MTHLWFLWLPLSVVALAIIGVFALPKRWLYAPDHNGQIDPALALFKDGWALVGWLVLVPMLIWLVGDAFVGVAYGIGSRSCTNSAHHLHVEHDYDLWAGCFVIVNGHEIPLDAYRATEQVNR